jgi:hypothetical protein
LGFWTLLPEFFGVALDAGHPLEGLSGLSDMFLWEGAGCALHEGVLNVTRYASNDDSNTAFTLSKA